MMLAAKKIVPVVALLVTFMLITTGCATIVSGASQDVVITSVPAGATVKINKVDRGPTPFYSPLKRKYEYTVTIKKDGFHPVVFKINQHFNPWYLGNLIFGGILGLILDPITGAIYRLEPDRVSVKLTPNSQPDPKNPVFLSPPAAPAPPAPKKSDESAGWQKAK